MPVGFVGFVVVVVTDVQSSAKDIIQVVMGGT
jgi:hypothetical protein